MEVELDQFRKFIDHSPFILIKGLRRIGKTSMIYTAMNEFKLKGVLFDLRALPYEGKIDTADFLTMICGSINRFIDNNKGIGKTLLDFLGKLEGIQIAGNGIILKREGKSVPDLLEIFEMFEKTAQKKDERIFLIFDEAQELRRVAKYRMDRFMAYIYDRFENVSLIVTGSEIGVLDEFLRLNDSDAPLYGRAIDEINLKPFSRDQSSEFLIKGYKEYEIEPSEDFINYALDRLDGIPGWLTFLGWKTTGKKLNERAVDAVLETASALAIEEFNHFLGQRWQAKDRYAAIAKILARAGGVSWKKLKTVFEIGKGRISDKNFSSLLTNLRKAGFITKTGIEYSITDPVLKHGLEK